MKKIKKYILLVFLIENLLVQSSVFGVSQWIFYAILSTGFFLLFFGGFFRKETYEKCWPLYILPLIYIIYQFTIGYGTISQKTLIYLLAKIVTYVIVVQSVVVDWEYYARKVPMYLATFVVVILFVGMNRFGVSVSDERLLLGFTNANTTSSLSALSLGTVIFYWNKRKPLLYSIMAISALYAMLAAGGRNAILMFGIMMFVWTGLEFRRIRLCILMLVFLAFIINIFSMEFAGVSRLTSTISGQMGTNRELEVLASHIMIDEKPITGWGFEAKNVGKAAMLSEFGSHNGYLETIKFMGYPFAIIFFLVLFFATFQQLRNFRNPDNAIRFHLAVLLSHLVGAVFEGLFVGVHEFSTNIIFYSLAVLTTYRYYQQRHVAL